MEEAEEVRLRLKKEEKELFGLTELSDGLPCVGCMEETEFIMLEDEDEGDIIAEVEEEEEEEGAVDVALSFFPPPSGRGLKESNTSSSFPFPNTSAKSMSPLTLAPLGGKVALCLLEKDSIFMTLFMDELEEEDDDAEDRSSLAALWD